ncbi:MAG: LuxR family transcriptional regulator [Pseudomonadota bacterium]
MALGTKRSDPALESFFSASVGAAWAEQLWHAAVEYFLASGFKQVSYHHLPPLGSADEGRVRVAAHGFPEEWVKCYIAEKLYRDDPIVAAAGATETPFRWSNIRTLRTLSDKEEAFMARADFQTLGDGLAIPVFGPNSRNGYFGLGFGRSTVDAPDMFKYQAVCQTAHLRYCRLQREQLPEPPSLSEREAELLRWVVRGKSNGVIADIMDISPHTVDAYLRRVFLKLGTSNRISAAVQALGNGLVRGY